MLVLGAGEMGEATATALSRAGVADLVLANRTWERAVELAERLGGRAVRLLDVADALVDADVLLSSTGATAALLQVDDVAAVVARRERSPAADRRHRRPP